MKKYSAWLFVLVVVALPVTVFGLVKLLENRYQPLPVLGEPGHRIAPFSLSNQQGKTITADNWKGKIVVADFFFTHCPSICPKMTYNLKRVQAYAGIDNLQLASFTVDPERDSTAQLKAYAQKMDIKNNWDLLTGDKKILYQLARKSFLIVATDGDGGPNDFIHSENLVLIDAQKRIRGFYRGTDEAQVNQLVRDIQKLAEETGSRN